MQLPIYVLDVFAPKRFSGNPAAVIPLEEWLEDEIMQKIAQENNQAETAFVLPLKGDWQIRWFTPTMEVNLCGHATMAAAHVIYGTNPTLSGPIKFFSRSGWLQVNKVGNRYALDMPKDTLVSYDQPPFLFEALGMDVIDFVKGREDFLALVADSQMLRRMQPDLSLIKRLNGRGLIVTAQDEEFDYVCRCFFPQTGIEEDPATGSAACTLAQYWTTKLNKSSFTSFQASPRGAIIESNLLADRVELIGDVVPYLNGQIEIDG
jgi:PhzF family phenazine biosynthesis protein